MNDLIAVLAIAALVYNTSPLPAGKDGIAKSILSAIVLIWCMVIALRSLGVG